MRLLKLFALTCFIYYPISLYAYIWDYAICNPPNINFGFRSYEEIVEYINKQTMGNNNPKTTPKHIIQSNKENYIPINSLLAQYGITPVYTTHKFVLFRAYQIENPKKIAWFQCDYLDQNYKSFSKKCKLLSEKELGHLFYSDTSIKPVTRGLKPLNDSELSALTNHIVGK